MASELERLMLQYGVGSASTGAAPSSPASLATGATQAQTDQYNKALVDYNANAQAYKNYVAEYNARMQDTPQYLQSQYKTGLEPVSTGKQAALTSPAGVAELSADITNWAKQNPTTYSPEINTMANKYGVSGQDIYDATNNRWGNVLNAPTYGNYVSPIVNPPIVNPPIVNPPIVNPPIVNPPIVNPPIVNSPIVNPPAPVTGTGTGTGSGIDTGTGTGTDTGTGAADAITGGSDKPKDPQVDVEPLQDMSGNVIPNQPITNQPAPNNTALPPQATIDGIKSAAGAGISNTTIASTYGVTPDAVNTILNPTADSYTGFYDKTFGNTTKQDFSTDLKNAFDYKVGLNNDYQPVSTENSPLANIALGLANGYLGAADYIVAGVKSLLGSQTFAQELAHGNTEATNFKAESPISSLASTLTGQLAGAAVGGPTGAKSVVDLGKTVYDFLTGGYTATPSSLASERALGNKIDSTGYLQIDPKTQASIDAVSGMTNPVTGAAYGDYKSDPTIWDSITKGAGTIWDDVTGGVSNFVSPVTDVITGGGSTTAPTYQPPLTNTEIGNNFWNNGGGSSFNADYALGGAYGMPDFYTPAPDYFDYSSISNLSPEMQFFFF